MRAGSITIGEFAALTGTTVKTVLYYHKKGLLPQPQRSASGYRLYGAADLSRMRIIQQFKSLGMDLESIGGAIGVADDRRTLRQVLESLEQELSVQRTEIDARLEAVQHLLQEDPDALEADGSATESFELMQAVMGPSMVEEYRTSVPELYRQHRRLSAIVDGYKWGIDYSDENRALAEFFRDHPDVHVQAIALGKKLANLADIDEDDPRVEELASEAAAMVAETPELAALLNRDPGVGGPFARAFDQLVERERPAAQRRYSRLFHAYLRKGIDDAALLHAAPEDEVDDSVPPEGRTQPRKEHL